MSIPRIVAILLWIPFLLEASLIPGSTVPIPGFPLSVGRSCLVALGLVGLYSRGGQFFSPYGKVIFLLVLGCFVGTFFSASFAEDFLSFIGLSALFLGAYGAAPLLRLPETGFLLKGFFYLSYCYWIFYIQSKTLYGGELVTYGEVYRSGREDGVNLVNYHAFGMVVSVSVVFLAQLNGWLKSLTLRGAVFLLLGCLALFLTESRANFLITVVVLFLLYLLESRKGKGFLLVLVFFLLVGGYSLSYLVSGNERLARRFDVENTDYIAQTTSSRFEFVALAFEELLELPFGGGVRNSRVNYHGVEYQPHNQYLTFILFAGFLGLIAVVLWIVTFIQTGVQIIARRNTGLEPYLAAGVVTMLVLLTNDVTGAFFFLMLMFQVWTAGEVLVQNRRRKR